MNVTSLVVGLVSSFVLIGLGAGWLASRWLPGGGLGLTGNLLVGLAGAFAGGFLFGLAPLDLEDGLIGAPLAACVGAAAALVLLGLLKRV